MKFGFITLQVKDMDQSLQFYQHLLGLPLVQRHKIPNGELAFLGATGQPQIELVAAGDATAPSYAGFSVGIEVESLAEATKLLQQAGHPVIRGPLSPNPSTTFSFVQDPNGIEIELIEYH